MYAGYITVSAHGIRWYTGITYRPLLPGQRPEDATELGYIVTLMMMMMSSMMVLMAANIWPVVPTYSGRAYMYRVGGGMQQWSEWWPHRLSPVGGVLLVMAATEVMRLYKPGFPRCGARRARRCAPPPRARSSRLFLPHHHRRRRSSWENQRG